MQSAGLIRNHIKPAGWGGSSNLFNCSVTRNAVTLTFPAYRSTSKHGVIALRAAPHCRKTCDQHSLRDGNLHATVAGRARPMSDFVFLIRGQTSRGNG